MSPQLAVLGLLLGYLFGSIPSGMIVARVYRNLDLTAHGSGRTGATNVLRTLGPGAAAIVFASDGAKGVVPVLLARALSADEPWVMFLAAAGSVIGHTYSPFIGFKGGRGVTTGLAASAVAAPLLMLAALLTGALAILVTRYVSLGSILGAAAGGLLLVVKSVVTGEPVWAVWGVFVAGFIVLAHRDNIQRLLAGTERKVGARANVP